MSQRTLRTVGLWCALLVVTDSGRADDKPAPRAKPATADQLKEAIAACGMYRINYRMETDPFTKKPIHSFVVRDKVRSFPEIPFHTNYRSPPQWIRRTNRPD